MRANQIQASVPAPVASLPPREPMPTVHFSMARSVHFSMAIDTGSAIPDEEGGLCTIVNPPRDPDRAGAAIPCSTAVPAADLRCS